MTKRQIMDKIPFKLLAVFLLLAAGIGAGGYFYYLKQRVRAVEHIQTDLATIAQFKSEQIAAWRRERYGDAYVLAETKIFAAYVRRWFDNPKDDELKKNIYKRLNSFLLFDPYKEVILIDPAGRVRLFVGQDTTESISQATKVLIKQVAESKKILFSDFYYCEKCREVHLDLIAPLSDGQSTIGTIILRTNPDKYLFPLIQTWPTTSRSGETILVRREGPEIVYLNELKFQKGTAMKLRLPLSDTLLPAAMAAMGKEGVVEGIDYRDVPVAASIRHIPDSPWFMVAKVDKTEIYAPLKSQTRNIGVIVLLMIIMLAATLSFLWQTDRRSFYKKQYQLELEKQALVRHYDYLTKYANDIILLSDEKYNLIDVNERACQAYGYSREELLKMKASALRADETKPQFKGQVEEMVRQGGMVYETVHKRKDGSTFPVESSAQPLEIEGKKYLQGIIRDISERKQYEQKLQDRTEELEATNEELAAREEDLNASEEELRKQNEELLVSEKELKQQNEELQRAQDQISRHTRSVELLHQCSLELASMPAGQPLNEPLTEWLKKISGGFAVTFGEYDRNNKEIVLKRILLEPGALAKIEEAVGKRLLDLRSPVSPGMHREMMSEEVGVRHSLHDISFGAVPQLASAAIGAMLGLDRFVAIPYHTEGILYGTSVIAFKKGQPEPDQATLKAFGSLGAVSLRRAQAEANLQTSHDELQASYQEIEANNEELQAAEEELRKQNEELAVSEETLKKSQEQLKQANELAHIGAWSWMAETDTVTWTEELYRIAGLDPALPAPTYAEHPRIYAPESWARMKTAVEKAMSTGEGYQMELELIRPDGTARWTNAFGGATKDAQGKVTGLYGTVQDITERRQAEEALKIYEVAKTKLLESLNEAQHLAMIGSWKWDIKTDKVWWSDETYQIFGVKPQDYTPSFEENGKFIHPDDLATYGRSFEQSLKTGEPLDVDLRLIAKDGALKHCSAKGKVIKDNSGQPIGFTGTIMDTTERKRIEEENTRLLELLENASNSVTVHDKNGRFLYANKITYEMLGYTREEYMALDLSKIDAPESAEMIASRMNKLEAKGAAEFEVSHLKKDGTKIPMMVNSKMSKRYGQEMVISIATDITERKRNEKLMALQSEVLKVLTTELTVMQTVEQVVGVIKQAAEFDAVGLRLRTDEDYPFVASLGYSEEFLKAENTLAGKYPDGGLCRNEDGTVSLECTCGMIVSGKADPNNPLFTPGGSAWTNNSLPFLDVPPDADPRLNPRNRCIHVGFLSLALIPIRTGTETIGLLHLADRRPDRFTPEAIRLFEGIGVSIGVALARKQAEEKILNQLSELQRWQGTMLDREDRVMELKREVNEILARQGQPKKYGNG